MGAPVISSPASGSSVIFRPGETKDFRVIAADPDNGPPVTATFKVSDSQGNITPVSVTLQVQDTLTYSADPAPTGWTITQDSGDLALFHVKAP